LSFDNPSAAAEAKGRAADLQQALQQAGVNIGQSGLSFTSGGGQGQGAAWQGSGQSSYAQPSSPDTAPLTASANTIIHSALGASRAGGLDITI
jgi:flagellar hook-length control protein FliK